MRIITVTLNPALDKTASLDDVLPGKLNRLSEVVIDAGGKGINVSKMISAMHGESIATGFIGGGSGEEIIRTLESLNIANNFVRISSATRTNLKIIDHDGKLTEFNEPGSEVLEEDIQILLTKLKTLVTPDTIVVLSGSIPRGVLHDIYAKLISQIKKQGALAFLDADGPAFSSALDAKPDFIKPNLHEIMEFFNIETMPVIDELKRLCLRFIERGIGKVVLSMGEKGAMFVTQDESFYAPGIAVDVKSTVGAGDAMVGAIAYGKAENKSWRDIAALAMAASAGAVTTVGTKAPHMDVINELLGKVELKSI